MDAQKLRELILKRFGERGEARQIVFWHDGEGEYEALLDSLDLDAIRVHKLTGRNNLLTKKLLQQDDLTSDFLIYAPFKKPQPGEDWLLDMRFYSKEFSLDEVANLCAEFQVYDPEIKEIFKKHLKFFKNQERVRRFSRLLSSHKTAQNVYDAMFAVILGSKDPAMNIQRYVIASLKGDEGANKDLRAFGLEEKFWGGIERQFGYHQPREVKLLLAGILFTKLKEQLSAAKFPLNYEKYTCKNVAECSLFLERWLEHAELKEDYKELAGMIERDFKVAENITDWLDVMKNDPGFKLLEAFDAYLMDYFIRAFEGLGSKDQEVIKKRKNTLFYEKYKKSYEAIYWAIEFNLERKKPIPEQSPRDFIKAYTKDYYKIDQAYRKFYYFYSSDKGLEDMRDSIERAYVNAYLEDLSPKFSKQLSALAPVWQIEDVVMQKDFYKEKIKPLKARVIVIISDALRYEVARELEQEIKNDYLIKADTRLDFMLGCIPSYTRLGMASLLPHEALRMDDEGKIWADGILTEGVKNRDKILKVKGELKENEAVALSFDDLEKLSREELRERFSGLKVAYIYHDRIDKAGEHSENDVFSAVQETIEELKECVKTIFNHSLASHVILTSDHGFLYQYGDVQEHQKITLPPLEALKSAKRFILSRQEIPLPGVMNFKMDYVFKDSPLIASIPYGVHRFKTQGAGVNYVHGASSLQEIVIPVLSIKQNKKQEVKPVDLILQNTSKRITNNKFTLQFLQKESISETIKPREFSIRMWDEENTLPISSEIRILADIQSERMEERIFTKTLELTNFKSDKNKDYYLIIRDVEKLGEPYERIAFRIDLVFEKDF